MEVKLEIRQNNRGLRDHQQLSPDDVMSTFSATNLFIVLGFSCCVSLIFRAEPSEPQRTCFTTDFPLLCKYLFRIFFYFYNAEFFVLAIWKIDPLNSLDEAQWLLLGIRNWPFHFNRMAEWPINSSKNNRKLNGIIIVTQIKCCFDIVTEKVLPSTSSSPFTPSHSLSFHSNYSPFVTLSRNEKNFFARTFF